MRLLSHRALFVLVVVTRACKLPCTSLDSMEDKLQSKGAETDVYGILVCRQYSIDYWLTSRSLLFICSRVPLSLGLTPFLLFICMNGGN